MTARGVRSYLSCLAIMLALYTLRPSEAWAVFDMSGEWFVQTVPSWLGPFATEHWEVVQIGTSVTATVTADPPFSYSHVGTGTIDPETGRADFGCPITIAPDRRTFTGCPFIVNIIVCGSSEPFFAKFCAPQDCCNISVPVQYVGSRLLCQNGVVDAGEECDDGNNVDGDGCDSNCTVTACGNGIAAAGEECDDSNGDDADACKNDCTRNVCGDGIIRTGVEECDDGNLVDGDGCDANCTVTRCGNHVVSNGEQCDDGNSTDGDGCDSNCTVTACGNGIKTAGEACDDGNTVNGDGCSAQCQREHIPGGGAARTDCIHEWVTQPVAAFDSHGLPGRQLVCTDDDPLCDFGAATGDQACTFLVGMCFNVPDSALQCSATAVRTAQFLRPKPGRHDPNRVALESAVAAIGGHIQGVCRNRRSGVDASCVSDSDCDTGGSGDGVCSRLASFGAGLSMANVCTALTPVRVPAGRGRFGKSMLRLRTEATSASNRRVHDIDALTLICRPAP